MAAITIPDVLLRTTFDGTGYSLGVAAGSGRTAPLALPALSREATTMAQAAAGPLDHAAVTSIEDGTWGLKVIDVRLTHGPGPVRMTAGSPADAADHRPEPAHPRERADAQGITPLGIGHTARR